MKFINIIIEKGPQSKSFIERVFFSIASFIARFFYCVIIQSVLYQRFCCIIIMYLSLSLVGGGTTGQEVALDHGVGQTTCVHFGEVFCSLDADVEDTLPTWGLSIFPGWRWGAGRLFV